MVKRWMKMIQIYLWGISNHLLNLTFPGWNKTQVSSRETHSISLKWSGNWCEVLFFSCLIVSNLDYKFMRIPINYWWNAFWLYSIGYLDNYCLGKPNHTGYLLEIYIALFLQLRFQKKRYEKIDNKVFLGYFVLFCVSYCLDKPNSTGYLPEIYIVLIFPWRFQKKRIWRNWQQSIFRIFCTVFTSVLQYCRCFNDHYWKDCHSRIVTFEGSYQFLLKAG